MRLMITDSGLGGLSVCAQLEMAVTSPADDLEIMFVNANPHADGGYNSLPSQTHRIEMFDRFLRGSFDQYKPDRIAIACNTLSVIYHETTFSKSCPIPVDGIVDAAVSVSNSHLATHPEQGLIIFATETTTEAGTYPRLINSDQIVSQACPDLASAITRDASGQDSQDLLRIYADEALKSFQRLPEEVGVLLACTHYPYQSGSFDQVLRSRGVIPHILDPNTLMTDQLIQQLHLEGDAPGSVRFRFVSRFPIPEEEVASLSVYLEDEAPLTLQALLHQEINPDLFAPKR